MIKTRDKLREAHAQVTKEILLWKTSMRELARIFHGAFPPIPGYSGWTLSLSYCSKSKQCTMCPHAVSWRRFYYKHGKLIWARGHEAYCRTGLPPIYASATTLEKFRQFEATRTKIMEHHHRLSRIRLRLAATIQNLDKKKALERGPDDSLVLDMIQTMSELISQCMHGRASLLRELEILRLTFPPSSKRHTVLL